jgi:hypothetical protein
MCRWGQLTPAPIVNREMSLTETCTTRFEDEKGSKSVYGQYFQLLVGVVQ